jgi:hypothetical protein
MQTISQNLRIVGENSKFGGNCNLIVSEDNFLQGDVGTDFISTVREIRR